MKMDNRIKFEFTNNMVVGEIQLEEKEEKNE